MIYNDPRDNRINNKPLTYTDLINLTSPKIAINDNGQWERNPYAIVMGKMFKDNDGYLKWAIKADKEDLKNADRIDDFYKHVDKWALKRNYTDSSLGGNDVINPYWSFCEDDDIIPPMNDYKGDGKHGMGRIYSKIYDKNQQILWLQFGVPEYSGIKQFFLGENINKLSKLMNSGESLSFTLGNLLGSGLGLAIKLPFLPLKWAVQLISMGNLTQSTKYAAFKDCMPIYYRMMNIIMSHLAVGMGLYPRLSGSQNNAIQEGGFAKQITEAGIPEVLKHGPDIFTIMDKRARVMSGNTGEVRSTDDFTILMKTGEWIKRFASATKSNYLGASSYIAFRIEKSTENSESFNNDTGASELASKLNGKVDQAKQRTFATSGGTTGISFVDSGLDFFKGTFQGAADSLGISKLLSSVTGAGYFNIEDTWKNSSFSKSYNFSIQLRARYGDPVSIYQSIYVPLAALLAGGMPRSVGSNMYTSPFYVMGYCKGMFAIPMGMIESMTIKRGLPEYGWSNVNLPTAVDVNLTIKDMSPTMHLTLADNQFLGMFARNDNLHEYLTTLSGLGLVERTYGLKIYDRKMSAAILINKNTVGNPLYWGMRIGSSNIARFCAQFSPSGFVYNK